MDLGSRQEKPATDRDFCVVVTFPNNEEFLLRHHNTLIVRYEVGDGRYNHIRHIDQDGSTMAFQPPEDYFEYLEELGCEVVLRELVDQPTIEWVVRESTPKFEAALGEILGNL